MEEKIDTKKLRSVSGGFATGVTVITAEQSDGKVIGMTASSFVCISLDPALVGFFVMDDASFMGAMRIGQPVAISILSSEQKAISDQFADRNKRETPIDFDKNGAYHKIADALAWYETEVVGIIPAGDHFLISCKVLNLDRDPDKSPILYYSGYKSIGDEIR